MKSASTMAANWTKAMSNPSTAANYVEGINSCQVNPMALAASPQAQQLYAQNTAAAVASGKMANALNAVPVSAWKDGAVKVGAQRFSSGAQKAQAKVTKFFTTWAPIYQQASAAAAALPKGGLANAMARVQASISVMMQAAGRA